MKNRTSNIELLRIFAMFLIILGHSASHGVFHFGEPGSFTVWSTGTGINKAFSALLLPGGAVGVGIFFMITGYFQINKDKYSLKKLFTTVLFYGLLVTLIGLICLVTQGNISGNSLLDFTYNQLIKNIFNPLSGGAWWYVSAYLLLMILSPIINTQLKKLSAKGFIRLLIAFLVIWYALSYLTGGSYSSLERGIFFYSLGAFCRLHGADIFKKNNKVLDISLFIVFWISGAVAYYIYTGLLTGTMSTATRLATDMLDLYVYAIATPVCAFTIFRFFEGLKLGTITIVNTIAASTFGIYLFHDSNIIRPYLWNSILKMDSKLYFSGLYPLYAILAAVIIFICCMIIDLLRAKLFDAPLNKFYNFLKNKAEALQK